MAKFFRVFHLPTSRYVACSTPVLKKLIPHKAPEFVLLDDLNERWLCNNDYFSSSIPRHWIESIRRHGKLYKLFIKHIDAYVKVYGTNQEYGNALRAPIFTWNISDCKLSLDEFEFEELPDV